MEEFQWFLIALSVLPVTNKSKPKSEMCDVFPSCRANVDQSIENVPSGQHLGNLCPAITQCHVGLQDGSILLFRPSFLGNIRVEVIVPPFTALLADTSWKIGCNQGPLLSPVLSDKLNDLAVFLGGPRSLDKRWLENFLPPMEALNLTSAR